MATLAQTVSDWKHAVEWAHVYTMVAAVVFSIAGKYRESRDLDSISRWFSYLRIGPELATSGIGLYLIAAFVHAQAAKHPPFGQGYLCPKNALHGAGLLGMVAMLVIVSVLLVTSTHKNKIRGVALPSLIGALMVWGAIEYLRVLVN